MADIRAIATGNWSAGGTWNGGVPPGVGDNAFANGFTVTIDQDITCTSINTTAGGGGVAGGQFTTAVARTINANVVAGSSVALRLTHTTGVVTVNGAVTGGSGTATYAIDHAGTAGSVVVNGNMTGGTGSGGHAYNSSTGAGALSVTGNLLGGSLGATTHALLLGAVGQTVVVVGNVTGGTNTNCYAISSSVNNITLTVTGVVTSGASAGVHGMSLSGANLILVVNGNCVGGSGNTGNAISCSSTALTATINGNCLGGNGGYGPVFSHPSGTVTVNGSVTGGSSANCYGLRLSSSGNMVVNGGVTGGGASGAFGIEHSAGGTLTVNGNVVAGSVILGMNLSGPGSTTVNGNVTTPTVTNGGHGITVTSSHNLTVNGDVTGPTNAGVGSTYGINATSSGTVIVTGTVTGGISAGGHGMNIGAIGTYRVGVAKSNNYPNDGIVNPTHGISMSSVTYSCTVDALEFGSGGVSPLNTNGKYFIRAAGTNFVKMRESNAGAVVEMGEIAADYPAADDVRDGVTYNSGGLTGTCKVPAAASVAFGVEVDATTGTAVLTQQTCADAVGPLLQAYGG